MEVLTLELWLPDDPFILFFMVFISIYVVGRMIWRLIPVVGG